MGSELCSIIPWSWKIVKRLPGDELQWPKFDKNRWSYQYDASRNIRFTSKNCPSSFVYGFSPWVSWTLGNHPGKIIWRWVSTILIYQFGRFKSYLGTNHIIKLRYTDTIRDLRKHLRSIVPDLQFRILSYDEKSQGWCPIEDEDQNLIELKLTPRAALQLGKCSTKSQIMSQSISELKSYADKTTNCTY